MAGGPTEGSRKEGRPGQPPSEGVRLKIFAKFFLNGEVHGDEFDSEEEFNEALKESHKSFLKNYFVADFVSFKNGKIVSKERFYYSFPRSDRTMLRIVTNDEISI